MTKRPTTNKPTPKPLPTPDDQKHRYTHTRFTVAVWWHEGYGGQESFSTLDEARLYAKSLAANGYPKWRRSQVHIWRDAMDLIDVIEAPEPAEAPE